MARSRSGQDLYGNAFRSVLWLIISMLPAPASSVPNTVEHNREREEREGDPHALATPEGTPGDRNASQGLVAAAQDQQQQGVHNNNSFSLSSSGRTTPAEAAINTPTPPLPVPTGAPTKSTQGGGQTEGGQENQQQLVRRKLHIDSLQAKVDEAKSAMDEIQNEMDGVSEAVVDETTDIAARAAVLSSEPVPDSMANLHQAITPRGTGPNTAAELNTSTLGTRASHNPLRSTRPRANTRRAASICEAASNISSPSQRSRAPS